MAKQIVQQRTRGFICINAHPVGCEQMVRRQIETVQRRPQLAGPRRALVVGASTGYGLASRIALGWGARAQTLGVFFERPPAGKRTATAGYYNTAALHRLAAADGLNADGLNGDAFSDEIKDAAAAKIRQDLGQVDLVIYSLASPRRLNPRTGETFQSALKPIGSAHSGKTIDLDSGRVTEATIPPAGPEEVRQTVAVMGGEDWRWWIEKLLTEKLLADGARTLAYSYVGPEMTWPIYRDGTIGQAKKDLAETADALRDRLATEVGGGAWVSVNKAVVTQASAAIPIVPLYVSMLFRVMKDKGVHEGAIEQMIRLFEQRLSPGQTPFVDEAGLIRLDDLELRDDVQAAVRELWPEVRTENLRELSDFAGLKRDFDQLFGFGVEGVDYQVPVETEAAL